jgi:hypothetical protein
MASTSIADGRSTARSSREVHAAHTASTAATGSSAADASASALMLPAEVPDRMSNPKPRGRSRATSCTR